VRRVAAVVGLVAEVERVVRQRLELDVLAARGLAHADDELGAARGQGRLERAAEAPAVDRQHGGRELDPRVRPGPGGQRGHELRARVDRLAAEGPVAREQHAHDRYSVCGSAA
jgi:hypothetical protein